MSPFFLPTENHWKATEINSTNKKQHEDPYLTLLHNQQDQNQTTATDVQTPSSMTINHVKMNFQKVLLSSRSLSPPCFVSVKK